MMRNDYTKETAHEEIDHIFCDLFPRKGMAQRTEQIKLSHMMFDSLLEHRIALCDAGTGIGKTMPIWLPELSTSEREQNMNAKDDLQYIIIMRCLNQMEREGVITSQEYARAKKAAQKELNPQSVWR